MNETRLTRHAVVMALGVMLLGCQDPDRRPGGGVGVGIGGLDGGDTTEGDGGTMDGDATEGGGGTMDGDDGLDGGGPKFDIGDGADDGQPPPGEEECASVDEAAELVPVPADIIFVVDNSGSMAFEAGQIQAHMNDFSSQIIASGIDVHVVLISSYPGNGHGICIGAPLGSGGCPGSDNNPPTFTHVNQSVGSHNAWQVLLATHGQWAGAMRADSVKHIVVVTDDTSNLNWSSFDTQFKALHPSYADYVHHSVVCHSNCASAAGIGSDYITLSNNTGGVAADLCDQDFQAVFDVLTTEVIGGSALACEFAIPMPPDGMEFNPDQVNLEFDDGMGGVMAVGRVDSAADCPNVVDGWYYDNPAAPTSIVMCEQTCNKMQAAENGSINIQFGCATVPAG
ncbi:vWA domain-containing protein [Paraliomyxa miuraensis]|uniref:hypothetical protein n=1 Tax=Paraliomyxa miuraensis TaxID=376150 RepID=UPI002253C98B|nr:hypothetical protein [Paraliomyxa miuraensis]MCX4239823.1 hypothetical protein [Paraliomyxa miuraensis]